MVHRPQHDAAVLEQVGPDAERNRGLRGSAGGTGLAAVRTEIASSRRPGTAVGGICKKSRRWHFGVIAMTQAPIWVTISEKASGVIYLF